MRITESQLRRIIKQEARRLHEGPGRRGRVDTQTEVNVDGALSLWHRVDAVTDAQARLKHAQYMAKGITPAQVDAALDEAIATLQGLGMADEEVVDYLNKRVLKRGFSEEGQRDIERAIYERLGAGTSGY